MTERTEDGWMDGQIDRYRWIVSSDARYYIFRLTD